ncbi:unnamed protein product [Paramecium octaurelia]|uniref:Uncharacterized protein n=1 Tax=Paramecium octaurelia TaxID=43137 RepID=A0A8S1WF10_PAROT|nr:unnamed protein product [Paramecium octaurelia]
MLISQVRFLDTDSLKYKECQISCLECIGKGSQSVTFEEQTYQYLCKPDSLSS